MSRSLKKGPYIYYKLEKRAQEAKNQGKKQLLKLGHELL